MPIITKLAVEVDWDAELAALLASESGEAAYDALVPSLPLTGTPRRRPARWAAATGLLAVTVVLRLRRR